MSTRHRHTATAVILLLAGAAGAGFSADEHFNQGACKQDVQKLCANVQPGEGRIAQCMKQHQSELSDACKQNLAMMKEKMKQKMEAVEAACREDLQKFCADVKPGGGRKMACLKEHQGDASPACQTELASMKPPMRPGSAPAAQGAAASNSPGAP